MEQKTDQSNLDSLWKRLIKNQVLTLPTQDSLNKKMLIYTADSTLLDSDEEIVKKVSVMDGMTYRFEIKSPGVNRIYNYHSPEAYLKHNPNIEELFRAYMIISIIKKHLGIKLDQ